MNRDTLRWSSCATCARRCTVDAVPFAPVSVSRAIVVMRPIAVTTVPVRCACSLAIAEMSTTTADDSDDAPWILRSD